MTCMHPLQAFRGVGGIVVFDKRWSKTKVPFSVPCGRCIGCRMDKARQWGIRCLHEKRSWPKSCYVTLTYDDESLPPGGTLCLRDVQLFMKKLRKSRSPATVRYFLGGEYGEQNLRPHYHALLFNCDFPDKRPISPKSQLCVSDELNKLWGLGHASVGEVTFESAVYCAKYALKKVNGANADDHYTVYDADGIIHRRKSEFAVMSLKPGIGYKYFKKYSEELLNNDDVIVNSRHVKLPRYYDVLNEREQCSASDVSRETISCHCRLCRNKRRRKRLAVLNRSDNTPERLAVKEELAVKLAARKERKL